MTEVLFVCLGNICRSPMAEALLRHKVRALNLGDEFVIDSAGTGNWHVGEPAHPSTRAELQKYGIDASNLVARQLTIGDLVRFDWILTMDESNRKGVSFLGRPRGTLAPVLSFHPATELAEVPDPWYTSDYAQTFCLLDAALDGFLEHLGYSRCASPTG
jgi:protein-tyrosine phosphatase